MSTFEQLNIIRVAIADDHLIFRKSVIHSLRQCSNIKFVQEADNGQELIDHLPETNPHVVLMDIKMPVKDGIGRTKYINRHFPSIKILILSIYEDEKLVGQVMDSGANGYILKSSDPAEIRKAIFDVTRKGFYLNSFVNKILIKKNYSKQKSQPYREIAAIISEREHEELNLFFMDYIIREIARILDNIARAVEAIKDWFIDRFDKK